MADLIACGEVDKAVDERPTVKRGDRVFVGGTVCRYGHLTSIIRTWGPSYYMVLLDGSDHPSGPYTEVWPELKAPASKAEA